MEAENLVFSSAGVVLLLDVLGLLEGVVTKAVVKMKYLHCKA